MDGDAMDVDDEAPAEAFASPNRIPQTDAGASASSMDWVETPQYWRGWGGDEASPTTSGAAVVRPRTAVIVDTNVLIESADELRDLVAALASDASFCIPWIVLSELDKLKSSRDEAMAFRARRAIKYLGEIFAVGTNPHFLGQSMREFKCAVQDYGVASCRATNDDMVLQCALQKQDMSGGEGAPLVVLTNDKNLLVKSAACGLCAATPASLVAEGRPRAALAALVPPPASPQATPQAAPQVALAGQATPPPPAPRLASSVRVPPSGAAGGAVDVSREVNATLDLLRGAIAAFVSGKFRENFGDDWEAMVAIPPPWTASQTLTLLEMHWFSLDLSREAQSNADMIR